MDFYDGQISYDGLDTVEIPFIDKKIIDRIQSAMIIAVFIPLLLFIKFSADKFIGAGLIVFFVAVVCLISIRRIIFLFYKKKKLLFGFDTENFIFNGEQIKWSDIRKITYKEFINRTRYKPYNITIYYEYIADGKKDVLVKELTGNNVLKISSKEAAKLIADKFYRYYGFSHSVMLKKSFFSGNYELKPASQKDVLQKDTDSSTQGSELFR